MVSSIMSETTFTPISLLKMMSRRNQAAIQQGIRCREHNPSSSHPLRSQTFWLVFGFANLDFSSQKQYPQVFLAFLLTAAGDCAIAARCLS
ncbi:hypothetical protein AB3R30_24450 [Leptolyngbyaceae cyanobacterium UHCC 1019]